MKAILNTILTLFGAMQSCGKTEIEELNASKGRVLQNQKKSIAAQDDTRPLFHLDIMNVYIDKRQYNIRYRRYSGPAASELIALSPNAGNIYIYDSGLVAGNGTPLASIVNKISPYPSKEVVWKEVIIKINRGESPVQFRSERELLAAVRNSNGMIQLMPGTEAYQGSMFEFEKQVMPDEEN
ncbi:MAG TPA: hypothetical protein VK154_18570 [Chitinophagales bacterium]|nr:hypothetical protein [Chitinophagales bacterium]